jgi:hypothetical protein
MTRSRRIAGIVGPTILAVAISELVNHRIWSGVAAPVVYLDGTLLFVAGLSIVRAHNVWSLRWPVLVTLVGWAAIFGGLYRMFAPDARQAPQDMVTFTFIALLALTGLFLTYMAYRPLGRPGSSTNQTRP